MNFFFHIKKYFLALGLGLLLASSMIVGVDAAVRAPCGTLPSDTPCDVLPTAPQVFQNLDDVNNTQSLTGDQNNVNRNLLNEGPKRILDFIFGTFATVGAIICVIAGIRIIFSNGDTKKFQEGIKAIVYAVIGIMVVGAAWMTVRAILSINPGN